MNGELKMKICTICKIEKPLDEFYRDSKRKDGFGYKCIPCQKAYYKSYNASRKASEARTAPQSKVCRTCKVEKPISQFGKKSTSLDKHNIYCNPCWRQRTYESMRRNGR